MDQQHSVIVVVVRINFVMVRITNSVRVVLHQMDYQKDWHSVEEPVEEIIQMD